MHKLIIAIGILIMTIIAGVVLIILPPKAQAPTTTDSGNAAAKADLIVADSIKAGDSVSSPLTVSGKARGTWYFEASFPYELQDAQGKSIAQGPVQANGDWMTTDFVPFSVSITFPLQPAGSKGTLILKKDNPSGDPAKEDSLIIPVVFK